jgi:hypothetical protein
MQLLLDEFIFTTNSCRIAINVPDSKMTMMRTIPPVIQSDPHIAERVYARSSIFTSWVICALLTAIIAWTLRQHPFSFPPIAVQVSALLVNGLCWWLCTTRIWFRIDRPPTPLSVRFDQALKRLKHPY